MAARRATGRMRLHSPRLLVTARDQELLCALHEYRYLSLSQVERLFFVSPQTTARRVRILARAGYVSVFTPPGLPARFVMLGKKGAAFVEELGGAHPALGRAGVPPPKDYLFLTHFAAVTDLRIALKETCENNGVRLLGFVPEYLASRSETGRTVRRIRGVAAIPGSPGESLAHTPDGVFALERGGTPALFFLEADRGTEVVGDATRGVLRMIHFYLLLLANGGFTRYQEEFGCPEPFTSFRVLIVTTSEARVGNIREAGGRLPFEPAHAKRFIWLSTADQALSGGFLGRIWRSLDPADAAEYGITTAGGS